MPVQLLRSRCGESAALVDVCAGIEVEGVKEAALFQTGQVTDRLDASWNNDSSTASPSTAFRDTCATHDHTCLLYTSDAADEEDSVDLGGRRSIKKKKNKT
eukprot:TRINITY_DN8846_c0_g1_i1.p1 TRINITY_DN8846_c0_g1~~TRINITY_DN8846_c0_g1_i1.p1  ORF type:complete len:101 (-),score=21.34 TRINITY_DN8846_c0_g1_i1:16-318(-)